MPSSLVKFSNRTASGKNKLFWERVNRGDDSYPFRGPYAPSMTEDEFAEKTVKVADARNAFFDVTDEAQNAKYLEVVECCWNGWFRLVHLERFWVDQEGYRTSKHYVEWVEYYLEDGTRTAFHGQGIQELSHGSQNFFGHPGQG